MELLRFSWIDYTLFTLMFGLSGIVGIYFGYVKKQTTTTDYLLGGKKMNYFPVSMSLAASTLSGITFLGWPSEIYLFGSQFMFTLIGLIGAAIINNYIFLPILYNLQVTNSYDYLEMRFDKKTKTIASVLYAMTGVVFLPIAIYAPVLAFNQVTGFNLHVTACVMTLFCIFYTSIGGLKAVVWTDTLQLSVTLCSLIFVFIMGIISVGGLEFIWEKANIGDRLEFFNINPDPTIRTTFWSVVIGGIFSWLPSTGSEPAVVQRFISTPTLRDARKCLVIFTSFTVLTKFIGCFAGLIMYAKYFDCDPLTAGYIQKIDQIVPYYVLNVAASIPGLSGLFIAGLFSTTLSTLSTYLNTLSGMLYNDLVSPFMPVNTTDERSSTIMKMLSVVIGLVCLSLILVVERLGTILELMLSLRAITAGPVVGLFFMGVLFPFANKKGAFFGALASLGIHTFICIQNKILIWNGAIKYAIKPLSTVGCNATLLTTVAPIITNITSSTSEFLTDSPPMEEPFWMYKITFQYYVLMGALGTLLIGLPISWATRNKKEISCMNPKLLLPCIRNYVQSNDLTKTVEELEMLRK